MLLQELYFFDKSPIQLYSDNQSCIKLVDNHVFYVQTKHIEIILLEKDNK